nr:MAG TPA: hypothetical protein [Caudoviricetes sp.]
MTEREPHDDLSSQLPPTSARAMHEPSIEPS